MAKPRPQARSNGTDADRVWMRKALRLAARARGRTAPNPLVGSIVVRGGRRIASGYHVRAGLAHAEASALARAGARARGATLYITLEPCAHHGRTPPCVDTVLASGVRRVVIGALDPDPRTAGRSVRRLRRAGIDVCVGVEAQACRELNRGFESRLRRGRPHTILKLAASLDGRIATRTGDSHWVTGEPARAFVHELRDAVDAVAVGSGTALADDPELTARRGGRVVHRPLRIVVDTQLRLSPRARMLDRARPGSTLVLCAKRAAAARRRRLEAAGARVVPIATRGSHLDLKRAWRALAAHGVNEVLVEGGGGLAAALLRAQLVDRLYLFLAPILIGADGRPMLADLGVTTLQRALRLARVEWRRVGEDLLLVGEW
jgi:diaminohydroxyphosphoribosylaminopyrimidine deaminase / 5-amino-6-(5-phosphoribosylamino)uracil reductase